MSALVHTIQPFPDTHADKNDVERNQYHFAKGNISGEHPSSEFSLHNALKRRGNTNKMEKTVSEAEEGHTERANARDALKLHLQRDPANTQRPLFFASAPPTEDWLHDNNICVVHI
jgi:hypothetical protein